MSPRVASYGIQHAARRPSNRITGRYEGHGITRLDLISAIYVGAFQAGEVIQQHNFNTPAVAQPGSKSIY